MTRPVWWNPPRPMAGGVVSGDEQEVCTTIERFGDDLLVVFRAYIDGLSETEEPAYPQPEVERPGGWCSDEYGAVQHGRAMREEARYYARRSA